MLLKTRHTVVWCGHTCVRWSDCPTHSLLRWLCVSGFRLVIVMILTTSGSTMFLFWRQTRLWSTTQQHLAQRQGSVHLLVVHFRCDSHILFQLPHGKLETQLRTLKPAPTVSRSSAVEKAVSLLKILKTALLIPGTMSCTEELGMSKASDSTQYDSAVCASCL